MVYGYARVSTKEQNLDRQIIDLKKLGLMKDISTSTKQVERTSTVEVGIHLLELWTLHLFFVKVIC